MTNPAVTDLINRSNRLGANPKNTNFAGGNTSAKGSEIDPVTGEATDLLWVKGSGGDLGTLTESGLAVLRLDRMRALVDVYPGVEREDEMVAAFDYCLHGKGGAAPSIDTAMHGLVDANHVDHLHPDSGIAIATAVDGEEPHPHHLRRRRGVGAVAPPRLPPWPRHRGDQGGEPAGDRLHPRRPRHHRVGRHLRRVRGALAAHHRHGGRVHRAARQGRALRPRAGRLRRPRGRRAPGEGRRARPDDPGHRLDRPTDGRPLHRRRRGARLPEPRRASAPRRARHEPAPTTSCAPRSSPWCWTCPPTPPSTTPRPG
ncbi:class II aldolase/adducin family protein [Demequina litorisediminis]|uniref:Class II aldolase/adducin N-terminal domain-containing protein n=1 Tax=Demequina litorisediminis TaxID=1849022 RepID=A0ABQ6IFD5_9MICO|nr:hypothetical protein GCM10025876_28130 [Demequina litorisediminis]